eukprot:TRINITY_DN1210_c0_g2_i1.p1 TRINITY_DN1210_c0_g2~~TRINITY_DN1210_c0_g2_i1.p1  ORF type:complete len:499 (-),score=130.93 TRINITY_DN1210_c0_g2_i1:240-1616(-)
MCGWVNGANSTQSDAQTTTLYDIYKVLMITTYTEAHVANGQKYERTITSSFLLSVQFAKRLEALLTQEGKGMFQVAVAAELLDVDVAAYVVGDSLFEPSSGSVYVTFRTNVQWPFAIDPVFVTQGTWTPSYSATGTVDIATQPDSHQPFGLYCDAEHSECTQQWVSIIQIGQGDDCVTDLAGIFSFTGNVVCRNADNGVGACQNPTTVTFHIRSETTDLCDNPDFDTDVTQGSTYTLAAFSDSAYSSPSSAFETGETAYFSFTVTTPHVSVDQIKFTSIVLRAHGTTVSDNLFDGTTVHPACNFEYHNLKKQVHPGQPGVLTFSFSLLRDALDSVNLLSVNNGPSGLSQTLSIEAVVDIFFHGNGNDGEAPTRKRSVQIISPITPANSQDSQPSVRTAVDRVQIHVRPSQSDLKKMTNKRGEMEEENIFTSLEGEKSSASLTLISIAAVIALLASLIL